MKLTKGDSVKDKDGNIGSIVNADDPHNIEVVYYTGGSGLYCMVEGCPHYDKLSISKNK